jgi:hypothetical protein
VLRTKKRNKIVRKLVRAANAMSMLDTIMQNPKIHLASEQCSGKLFSLENIKNRSYYLISVFLTDLIGGGNFSSL